MVENFENLKKNVVNNTNVSGIDCVNKPSTKSCVVEASKTHVGVDSDKRSSIRLGEEISDKFFNEVLFESVAFVIDGIDKNAKVCLGSSLGVFEKTGKGAFMKFVDKETDDPVQEKPRENIKDNAPTFPIFDKSGDED
ncbi:unnamed protein product [Citrullus colocynthis]|uniref:Uncharacterized protein n=1 Tax=Citrullus colocynthis TaxID=252529 RepID=A0ABP0ZED6_9ROSI